MIFKGGFKVEESYYILEITNKMVIESIIELYKDYIESLEPFTEEVNSISEYHQWNIENRSEIYYLERTNLFSANEDKKIEVCEKTFLYPDKDSDGKRFSSDEDNMLFDLKRVDKEEISEYLRSMEGGL